MFPGVQEEEPRFTVSKLWHSFRRRWLLAVFVGFVLAVPLFFTVFFLMPDSFDVTATLECNYANQVDQIRFSPETFKTNMAHLVRNDTVINLALQDLKRTPLKTFNGVMDEKRFLQSRIKVSNPKESGDYLYVTMSGENGDELVLILEEVLDKFLKIQREQEKSALSKTVNTLRDDYSRTQAAYTDVSKQIDSLERMSLSPTNPFTAHTLQLLKDDMDTRLRDVIIKEQQLDQYKERKKIADLKKDGALKISEDEIEQRLKNFPDYVESLKDLAVLRAKLSDLRSSYKNQNHPNILASQLQVTGREREIAKQKASLTKTIRDNSTTIAPADDPLFLQQMIEQTQEALATSQAKLQELRIKYTKVGEGSTDLENKMRTRREYEISMANINKNIEEKRLLIAGIEKQPSVDLRSHPEAPKTAPLTMRLALGSLASMFGFAAGLCLIVAWENSKNRVNTVSDIRHSRIGMQVLGTVPNLAKLSSKSSNGSDAVSGVLAESIDSVRTMLLQGSNRDTMRVVMVTSANESEGKTTVATHLAASLARAGRRTLLVDGDLRKPSIHFLFGIAPTAGICEALKGEVEIESLIQPAHVEGLYLLQAGTCDHLALAALAKEQSESIFRTLRADYDYVIVDSGPVLGYADTMLLGSYADAAILSVLRDISCMSDVYDAKERLESVGINVLGGVVGRAPKSNVA